MSQEVKRRPYNASRRRAQAAETRREILASAERLFAREGFSATTITAIAAEAGVATRTVYLAFETKAGIVRALWNARLRGDEGEAPVAERPWFRAVIEERDPERKIRLVAANSRAVKVRVGPLFAVIRNAAAAEPDVAALWARIESEFHDHQRAIVATLAAAGALRPGLDPDRAADVLWTLNHPDVWRALVEVRGWTPDQWEDWFAATVASQLLARG